MGLFKKKPTVDPAEFLAVRAELQDVKARLDASEQAKASLVARLASLDATTNVLVASATSSSAEVSQQIDSVLARLRSAETETHRVEALNQRIIDVEAAQQVSAGPERGGEFGDLSPRLDALSQRLDHVAELAEVAGAPTLPDTELAARVDLLAERTAAMDAIGSQLEGLAAQAKSNDDLHTQLEQLLTQAQSNEAINDQLAQLAERVALGSNETRLTKEQLLAIEARISSVGTELANQLSELGGEIDALAAREPGTSTATDATGATDATAQVSEEVLYALRNGQARLANEQARFEIAFREDLATLAEQIRNIRGR